ncbi:MAG: YjgP/YjgQ family permease [Synechococcaceae cyanobacterium RL_1_2]|nr:YjgP/YjgQ family permease [Synechococcaceae cyanobacterium RL_1_2]
MGLSILDRYLLKEMLLPFLFGLGLFSSLGIAIGSVFDMVRRVTEYGFPLSMAMQVLFLRMPEFIVLAFPMAILLATLMAYSRLSSDSETIAFKSVGIHPYRLIIPALLMGLLISGFAFIVNDIVAPMANYQAGITMDKAFGNIKTTLKERNIIYPEYQKKDGESVLVRLFYAEEYDGTLMKNLTILDRSKPEVSQIINAPTAEWNTEENLWDFYNGTIYFLSSDGSAQNLVQFEHQQLALPKAPMELTQHTRDFNEMSISQAQQQLELMRLGGEVKAIRKLEVRIQQKIAVPFICIVFGLVGAALGVRPQDTSRATSFGICIGIIFFYYLFNFLSSAMGVWGVVSPFVAAWLPNIVGLSMGSTLMWRSAKI